MLIQRKQRDNKGMFYVENEGEIQAKMTYHMTAPDKMVIEHTEVGDDLRGQKVGYQLVEAAVEYARQQNIKITVWCPFAKKVFDKKPDWHDVLD
jgi:predicted GNAT family acetyltransferase